MESKYQISEEHRSDRLERWREIVKEFERSGQIGPTVECEFLVNNIHDDVF